MTRRSHFFTLLPASRAEVDAAAEVYASATGALNRRG
jgi:hypothetical protein